MLLVDVCFIVSLHVCFKVLCITCFIPQEPNQGEGLQISHGQRSIGRILIRCNNDYMYPSCQINCYIIK